MLSVDPVFPTRGVKPSPNVWPRYIVAAIDATVWSQNENVTDMIQMLANVCSTGSTCIEFIQLPLFHTQTTLPALLKRKRLIEDTLLKFDVDFTTGLTLLFQKDSTRASTDKRTPSQPCLVCAVGKAGNKWLEQSQPLQTGILGPFAVCAVSDMIGYDSDQKPGAAARAEQIHMLNCCKHFCLVRVVGGLCEGLGLRLATYDFLMTFVSKEGSELPR